MSHPLQSSILDQNPYPFQIFPSIQRRMGWEGVIETLAFPQTVALECMKQRFPESQRGDSGRQIKAGEEWANEWVDAQPAVAGTALLSGEGREKGNLSPLAALSLARRQRLAIDISRAGPIVVSSDGAACSPEPWFPTLST